jgi:hypothetical protein
MYTNKICKARHASGVVTRVTESLDGFRIVYLVTDWAELPALSSTLNRVRSHTVEAANHWRFLLRRGHERMCKPLIQYDTTTASFILHRTHRNISVGTRPHHSISASQPWSPESHQSPHRRSRAHPRNHRPNFLHSRNSQSADLSRRAQIPAWPSWPQCWVSSWNKIWTSKPSNSSPNRHMRHRRYTITNFSS